MTGPSFMPPSKPAMPLGERIRPGRWPIQVIGLLFAMLLPALGAAVPSHTQQLDSGWQFRLAPGDSHAAAHPQAIGWHAGTVPGTVQTDLMAAKLVADPYFRDNEAKIQWVGLSDWQYRTRFTVDRATLARRHIELVLDGLDTFADVYLNGHKILGADNMFRRWRVPVKPLLHSGVNSLEVRLSSPIAHLLPWIAKQPYQLPGEFTSEFGELPPGEFPLAYTRKAAYQYGWDWGPRILTEGIWQPVKLESWDALRLANFSILQEQVSAANAALAAQLKIQSDTAGVAEVTLAWQAPNGTHLQLQRAVTLQAGTHTYTLPFAIRDPARWWPVGYGKPNLYQFHVQVSVDGKALAAAQQETGLRSVELRRVKDQWGKSFEFVVNGVPIFAKGASFIPMDEFPQRVTKTRIRQLLESARDANMNMLRVWGGGYYQRNAFYTEADKLGLMIWQEFMFGGPIPPPSAAYRANTRIEAMQQVERLRNHPSIVLWCGNNEVADGWEYFDDVQQLKKSITPIQRKQLKQGMDELFDHTLRAVVAQYEPSVPYWPTSPGTGGEGPVNVTSNGDYHYWDVWSGAALPVTAFLDVTPRFMAEYGLQSMPVMATIDAFTDPADRTLDSDVIRAHQKYLRGKHYDQSTGDQRLLLYVERDFGQPKNLAAMVYLSQVMQAQGIQLAAEHLRVSRPQSMGSLYWQLNDVWPGTTWSSVDYYGRWKALQYHARRFYAPLLIAALRNHGVTTVSLVSDETKSLAAHWRLRVMDFAGKVLSQHATAVTLAPLASTQVARYSDAELLHGADPRQTFAAFDFMVGGKPVSQNLVFFGLAKDLALPLPHIHVQLAKAGDGYTLTLTTDQLAREVWVSFGSLDATVSDNSFNLLPGERVVLGVKSRASLAVLSKALTVQDLAAVMQADRR